MLIGITTCRGTFLFPIMSIIEGAGYTYPILASPEELLGE
jgi:hypothetical protein